MQSRHTGDAGDKCHRRVICRISRRTTICRTPSVCSTHTPVKLHLTSAPNVSAVLSSLSPSLSSPCLPPTPATASPSTQTISLTASLCPPSYSPALPPPPYLSVHPLLDIPQLTDTQLMRFAIGQLVWLLDMVRHNVHLFRSGDVADLDGRRVISIQGHWLVPISTPSSMSLEELVTLLYSVWCHLFDTRRE